MFSLAVPPPATECGKRHHNVLVTDRVRLDVGDRRLVVLGVGAVEDWASKKARVMETEDIGGFLASPSATERHMVTRNSLPRPHFSRRRDLRPHTQ
jgi:hypothetical protein